MMERITVNIAKEIRRVLDELAREEGRTTTELIREAIVMLLRERGILYQSTNVPNKRNQALT